MLDAEREFYASSVQEWCREHKGQFVVVKERELVGFYSTIEDALAAGASRFGTEPFLVRVVSETEAKVSLPALTLGLIRATHP